MRRRRIEEIAAGIAELERERAAIAEQTAADLARWLAWWARKHVLEESLATAVRPLVDRPVVSVEPDVPPIG